MLRRFALLLGLGVVATVVIRPGVAVRTIRAIDRRGGLATSRGEVGYARIAGRLAGLHRRAARDIAEISAGRPLTVLDIGAGPGDLVVLWPSGASTRSISRNADHGCSQ